MVKKLFGPSTHVQSPDRQDLQEIDISTSFLNSKILPEPAPDLVKKRLEIKKLSLEKLGDESCKPDNPKPKLCSVMSKLEKEADNLL